VPRIEDGEDESVTPAAETTPAAESVTPAAETTLADESVTPAAGTTPAADQPLAQTTSPPAAENLEEILTLVAEEAIAEEIAEKIIAEEVAEEIVAETVAEEMAEEIIEKDVAAIMAIIDKAVTKEEAEEKIIAIIDTLPDTHVSTSAQPQENIIRDIINPVIIEEVKPIQLRITIQPGDTAVFKRGTVLGMSCDAYSELDNEVEFSWTKNGGSLTQQLAMSALRAEKTETS